MKPHLLEWKYGISKWLKTLEIELQWVEDHECLSTQRVPAFHPLALILPTRSTNAHLLNSVYVSSHPLSQHCTSNMRSR